MKTKSTLMFIVFAVSVLLAIPVWLSTGTALAKGTDAPVVQQTTFRWQMSVNLTANTNSIPAEAVALLQKNGVNAANTDKQVVMTGQKSLEQMRTALFDTAAPWMDFLGAPIDLTLYLPANGAAITLQLESRLTAGYRWEVVSDTNALYDANAEPAFSMRYESYGAPSIQTIQLRAARSGDTTVHLVYRRSFEPAEAVQTRLSVWMPVVTSFELSDPTPTRPAQSASASLASTSEPNPMAELLPKVLPTAWDWRTQGIVTPIRNQGGCGSCWAFGTVGAMEAALKKSGGPMADLSEQFLVSCNTEGWNCSGGWDSHEYHFNTLGKNQSQIGAVLESDKPYTSSNGTCTVALNHPYKLTNWGYVGGLNSGNYWYSIPSYEQLKNAIYTYGPITAGVCVGNGFSSYSGGLFATNEASICGSSPNHLIVLVGWNDANQSLILRNSWGTYWGENGYMQIKYGTSMVGVAPTWVTRISSQPVIPTLVAPAGIIYNTKPAYTWSMVGTTSTYKLQVYDIAAATYPVNMIVSNSYCNASTNRCTYTPNVSLTNNKYYQWRAAAGSGTWSAWKIFQPTIAPTFNSQFNGSATGWVKRPGAAWNINTNYYYTSGMTDYVSSASYNANFTNFTYTAKMMRTGSSGYGTGLVVRGTPTFGSDYDWLNAYEFLYTNNGNFSVWKGVGGSWTSLKTWTSTASIVPNGWNTLKVVANGSALRFYINNVLVWSGTDTAFSSGQVGLWMYRSTTVESVSVDWATLGGPTAASSNKGAEEIEQGQVELVPEPGVELVKQHAP